MSIRSGKKFVQKLYVGGKPVRAVYAGRFKVWPDDAVRRHELRTPSWEWRVGNRTVEVHDDAYGGPDGTLVIDACLAESGDDAKLVFSKLERVGVNGSGTVMTSETVAVRDLTLDIDAPATRNLDIALYAAGSEIFIGFRKDDYSYPAEFNGVITISDSRSEARIIIYLSLELL
ncbi:hypothetical protein [Alistipes timonensis]|uniref:hypothetical protein n=1 Tax=Alistipes timonensis TaxID=1465754 RepID=UPI00266EED75|nr:hypothetical protein [Alistipes timonensis]